MFELKPISFLSIAVAGLFLMPSAFADCQTSPPTSTTACMDLTSPGNNAMGGVYVGPYTATINGVSTAVICDDFYDDSYIGELWTADIVAGASAPSSSTRMDANYSSANVYGGLTLTQAYDAVGYLALQMLTTPTADTTTIGELDFALWSIFDYPGAINYGSQPGVYNQLSPAEVTAIDGYLASAAAYAEGSNAGADIAQFTVYSPDETYGQTPALGNGITPPQEFLVHTPEPASLALLGIDLSGVAGLILLLRRRRRRHKA